MKGMLFTMTALALMGGQVFADNTAYKVSDYKGADLTVSGTSVTVSVDDISPIKSCNFNVRTLELLYDGSSCLNVTGWATLGKQGTTEIRNITATASVAQSWIDALTAADSAQVTIISAQAITIAPFSPDAVQLQGTKGGNSITLTGTTETLTAKFVGYRTNSLTLQDGEIGLLLPIGYETLALVGKGLIATPLVTTPEPATATLSLLALAGLASRRRRR